jgi:mRNA-degrading endonuclease YafQ of YafQ-DinJ toxin-antitoxin module
VDLQIVSIVISAISLFVALFSVRMAWNYKQASERLSANSIFSSQLITVHKCLIDQPELWMTYDDHPLTKTMPTDPSISARIDGYLYMVFNLLSTTYGFYVQYIGEHKMRTDDREYWEAWKYFATELLKSSSKARELFKYPTTQRLYPKSFVSFMNGLIRKIEEDSV